MLKVLIVEDDLMLADFAEEILVEHGYEAKRHLPAPLPPKPSRWQGIPNLTLSCSI